jgi:hypothetical protein
VLRDEQNTVLFVSSTFDFTVKILNILHPQLATYPPVALFTLTAAVAADGVSVCMCQKILKFD